MARHEGDFQAAAEAEFDLGELAESLNGPVRPAGRARQEAIALCLSAGEGWRDAAARLGGAFAGEKGKTGLTGGKEK